MQWPFARPRMPRPALGRAGERRARLFYRLRGFSIVGSNIHLAAGELDLVARRGKLLVIVEVKTRQSESGGEGYERVDAKKRLRLVRCAEQLVTSRRELAGLQIRYDIISIRYTGWRFVIRHFADAFRPVADAHSPWKWTV